MDITHDDVLGLFCLTMLIYDYGKKFVIDESQTLEEFMNSDTNPDLSKNDLEALDIICERTSQGKVVTFLNDKETDLQAGITLSEKLKAIYVVFRGSESKLDWWYDLQVGKDDLNKDIKVHKGFYGQLFDTFAYNNLRNQLKLLLEDPKYTNYDVFVTGHSLCSGVGLLFGYFIADEIPNKITLVTFASPRVGNLAFVNSLNSKKNLKHYRITTMRDVITVLPVINYYHSGINIRLCDDEVEIYENDPSKEFTIFSCWDPREHYCDCYYDRLKKLTWTAGQTQQPFKDKTFF